MRRTWTIIAVQDVFSSLKWYQALLGLTPSTPEHDYFGQVLDADGTVLLCLHRWGDHEHPPLSSPENGKPGNRLLLFLRVDDFDETLSRARNLMLSVEEEPHIKTLSWRIATPRVDLEQYLRALTAELSRAAKRHRPERTVRPQPAHLWRRNSRPDPVERTLRFSCLG